jgi:hypothetical protein
LALYYQSHKNYAYLYRRDIFLFIFIRNFIDPQGSDGFHKLLALVFMALQDPIAITALNPFCGWFGLQNLFLLCGSGIGSACACLPLPLAII